MGGGQRVSVHAIHAYLTIPAHTTWHTFSEDNGVSASGLLEAIAEQLEPYVDRDDLPNEAGINLALAVKRARKIDAMRRRRGQS